MLTRFDPLIIDILAVAAGDSSRLEPIEKELLRLEAQGWHLSDPIQQIWAGERDLATLSANLSLAESITVQRILELLEYSYKGATI